MGCGASQPVTKDAMPIEEKQTNGTNMTASTQQNPAGIKTTEHAQTAPLPTSMFTPVEFGLVKGWEAGDKTSPALLVIQVVKAFGPLVLFQPLMSSLAVLLTVTAWLAQEWWGINEDIKEKAMMLHQKGNCRVFIPDLYKGKTTVEVAEAKHVSTNPGSRENAFVLQSALSLVICAFAHNLQFVVVCICHTSCAIHNILHHSQNC